MKPQQIIAVDSNKSIYEVLCDSILIAGISLSDSFNRHDSLLTVVAREKVQDLNANFLVKSVN